MITWRRTVMTARRRTVRVISGRPLRVVAGGSTLLPWDRARWLIAAGIRVRDADAEHAEHHGSRRGGRHQLRLDAHTVLLLPDLDPKRSVCDCRTDAVIVEPQHLSAMGRS